MEKEQNKTNTNSKKQTNKKNSDWESRNLVLLVVVFVLQNIIHTVLISDSGFPQSLMVIIALVICKNSMLLK